MRVNSADRKSNVDIQADPEQGTPVVFVSARVGDFTAGSQGVVLRGIARFRACLDSFEMTRSGDITLEGGEGFTLTIRAHDPVGHL